MGDVLDDALAKSRLASHADNEALIELMAHVPMEGSLVLSTQRGPDFFALYEMQRGSADTHLAVDDEFAGMGAILARDGWLDGKAQPVGYLGDLRIKGTSRIRRAFPLVYGRWFAEHQQRTGCSAYLTAVLAENAMAIASLATRKKKRATQPYYHLLRRYEMSSVQLVLPPRLTRVRTRHDARLAVTTARAADVPALVAFLDADHRARPFGYRFDDGELEHRLAHWPGFTLDDTFVARRDGAVVGVCTAWDAAPVKRYRVMRYARDMKLVRAGVSLASLALGCPPLPREGEDFRSLYLVNLSVAGDDPAILRALLDAVYAHAWKKRVHFIALPLWPSDTAPDPLERALRGFVERRTKFHLYAVTASDVARTEWPAGRPGFEIALA